MQRSLRDREQVSDMRVCLTCAVSASDTVLSAEGTGSCSHGIDIRE